MLRMGMSPHAAAPAQRAFHAPPAFDEAAEDLSVSESGHQQPPPQHHHAAIDETPGAPRHAYTLPPAPGAGAGAGALATTGEPMSPSFRVAPTISYDNDDEWPAVQPDSDDDELPPLQLPANDGVRFQAPRSEGPLSVEEQQRLAMVHLLNNTLRQNAELQAKNNQLAEYAERLKAHLSRKRAAHRRLYSKHVELRSNLKVPRQRCSRRCKRERERESACALAD